MILLLVVQRPFCTSRMKASFSLLLQTLYFVRARACLLIVIQSLSSIQDEIVLDCAVTCHIWHLCREVDDRVCTTAA